MSAIPETRQHIELLIRPGERLKQAFPRIARMIGANPRRVRQLWSGEVTDPKARELDALRAARAKAAEIAITTESLRHASDLEIHASRLALLDPDVHGAEITRLRDLAGRARALAHGARP